MPLKLLQAEENNMINQIANKKTITLTRKNNQKIVQKFIASQNYTHIFSSQKIILFKKFKANILDHPCFASRLSLLAINKIHLIEEWNDTFQLFYNKIEKIQKRVLPYVLLLGVSAMLIKNMHLCIFYKARFQDYY